MRKIKEKSIRLSLKTSIITNAAGLVVGGGIVNPRKHLNDEIWVEIMEDPILKKDVDEEGCTGRLQIHVGSTRRAIKELGVILLALSQYESSDSTYSVNLELTNREGMPAVYLIFHVPEERAGKRPSFNQIHNISTASIDNLGRVRETTIPAIQKKGKKQN